MENKAKPENADKSDASTQATPTTADQQTQTPPSSPQVASVATVSPLNDQKTTSFATASPPNDQGFASVATTLPPNNQETTPVATVLPPNDQVTVSVATTLPPNDQETTPVATVSPPNDEVPVSVATTLPPNDQDITSVSTFGATASPPNDQLTTSGATTLQPSDQLIISVARISPPDDQLTTSVATISPPNGQDITSVSTTLPPNDQETTSGASTSPLDNQLTTSSNKTRQILTFKDSPSPSREPSRISKYSEDLDLDADVLEDVLFYVGEMGFYQKLMFLSMLLFTTFSSWVYLVQIFITVTPSKYWCKVSKLAGLSMELRRNLSAPGAATGRWDSCHTFDVDWDQILETLKPPPPQTPKIPCPDGWEFEFTDIPYETVVSERGWVCNRATYAPTAQSIFFIGSLTGGLVFGWIADNLGRIPALIGSNLIGAIGGITTIYTSGFYDFILCRFLVGMSYDNCFMIAYILILEYVGPGHRTWVANMPVAIFGGAASVSLPWIAYYVADWRVFLWITSLPMFIVIACPWFLPESVRWLVSRGRIDDAVKVVRRFEKVNKSHVPDHVMDTFVATSKKLARRKMESLFSLFHRVLLRTTMIYMVVVYSSNAVIYDTLVRLIEVLGLDFFVTFAINEGIEIPSVLALTLLLDRLGRRILTGGSLFIGSIVLFIATAVPKGSYRVAMGVLARFLINTAFTVLCQWGTEILPTPFRGSGSSLLHMSGFAFSLLSPFIVLSALDWPPLPLLIVSVWSIITASLSILLPETKGQEIPQTISDAEKIILNESLCKKPEAKEFKRALSKIVSTTVNDTVSRDPEGRVSHLRLTVSGAVR